ncbi:MAG: hypothetical protein QNJ98_00655 [Planctomycetota bacterium]|nr:hypothetical protein [Planctomycetota bacterium]
MRRLLLVLLLVLPAHVAWAEDPPPADAALRTQIQGWLEDLRADAYETRRKAREQLRVHGRRAPDLLEALVDDPDAEVRRTVRELLGPGWAPKPKPKPVVDLGLLAQVEVPRGATSVREALASIGSGLGARFELPMNHADALALDEPVRGPFFAVLETLAAKSTLGASRPFDATGTLKLEPWKQGRPRAPHAAAGPLGVRVVEVSATRNLTSRALRRYSLELELRWVPSVQLTQLSAPRLISAVDDAGLTFSGTAGRSTTTFGIGYTQTSRTVGLGLRPDDAACKEHLAKLTIEVPGLRMRTDARGTVFNELDTLPQVQDGTGAKVPAGTPGSIELRSITREGDARRAQYVVELAGRLPNRVARSSAQVFVTWSDGREQRLHVMGGRSLAADGTLNLTVRAWPRGDAKPASIRVRWYEREVEGTLRFTLADIPLR